MVVNGFAFIVWVYFIGWHFFGGVLIAKLMPNHTIIAKFIGAFLGLVTGFMVSVFVFHSIH